MYTTWDIYCIFRKSQAMSKNRGYRLPKDWNIHWENKLNKTARDNIQIITDYFNTKWCDISPEMYFEAGFDVYKSFSYHQFLNRKVIEMYKRKDKNKKRNTDVNKKTIIQSLKHVINSIEDKEKLEKFGVLRHYCRIYINTYTRKPIKDYIDNKISAPFLVWLISEGYVSLTDEERSVIPYIINNYRDILSGLKDPDMRQFLYEIKEKIRRK